MMKTEMIHRVPSDVLDACVEMLNNEWPRSRTARLHSLNKSRDDFPLSLVMMNNVSGKDVVIGHSRLSKVHGEPNALLIESVIVSQDLRGKGYGRSVMEESEKFALSRGYNTIFLTTHDKQDFYRKVGYSFCDPVICLGGNATFIPDHLLQTMTLSLNMDAKNEKEPVKATEERNLSTASSVSSPPPPPPPPPPVVKQPKVSNNIKWDPKAVAWMKKNLQTLPGS